MNRLKSKKNKMAQAIKTGLMLAGVSMMATSPVSFAIEEDDEVERISVTGSRIQRSTAATPTPTTILDS